MAKGCNLKGRFKALGIHLSMSVIIFAIFLWVMLKYWYPMPHFLMNGGWQGVRIMLMVDLMIGPFLTFLLFNLNKPKKELVMDLGIIVVIQASLLAYGIHAVHKQRPVVQVLSYNAYMATVLKDDLVYDKDIYPHPIDYINSLNIKKAYPPLVFAEHFDWKNPIKEKGYYANLFKPETVDGNGFDLAPEKYVDHYVSLNTPYFLSEVSRLIIEARKKVDLVPEYKKLVSDYETKHGKDKYYYFRLKGEYGEAVVVYSKDFKPVDYFGFKLYD